MPAFSQPTRKDHPANSVKKTSLIIRRNAIGYASVSRTRWGAGDSDPTAVPATARRNVSRFHRPVRPWRQPVPRDTVSQGSPASERRREPAYWRAPAGDVNRCEQSTPGRCELDRNEFERVYRAHSRAVYSTAFFNVGGDFAEEVTQETFLRFWQHPERFEPRRALLRTYLLTIARHVGIDMIRAQLARQRRDDRAHRGDIQFEPAPDHDLLRLERIQRLLCAIADLSDAQREVVLTICYGEISYRAVALVLGLPEGTVKSRVRSAFGELRRAVAAPTATNITTPAVATVQSR